MKLLRGLLNIPCFAGGTVATIGNFDGVHKGHQALLVQLREQADKLRLPLVVLLFEPQPSEYFQGQQAPARLSTLREKLTILRACKVDYVCCLKFNKMLASMPATDFANHYIFSLLQVKYLLIGEDFRFGKNRQGDVSLLQQMAKKNDCVVQTFPDFSLSDGRVSSTRIRDVLAKDDFAQVAYLLGRTYCFCGRVIKGDGRGRQWGIPTANLSIKRINLPLKGVFCVNVLRKNGQVTAGVANLGSRPTVDGSKNVLEIHLLDFDESLYGELLQVCFLHKLRDEIKFSSVDALIAQIHNDILAAKAQLRAGRFEFNALVE